MTTNVELFTLNYISYVNVTLKLYTRYLGKWLVFLAIPWRSCQWTL